MVWSEELAAWRDRCSRNPAPPPTSRSSEFGGVSGILTNLTPSLDTPQTSLPRLNLLIPLNKQTQNRGVGLRNGRPSVCESPCLLMMLRTLCLCAIAGAAYAARGTACGDGVARTAWVPARAKPTQVCTRCALGFGFSLSSSYQILTRPACKVHAFPFPESAAAQGLRNCECT